EAEIAVLVVQDHLVDEFAGRGVDRLGLLIGNPRRLRRVCGRAVGLLRRLRRLLRLLLDLADARGVLPRAFLRLLDGAAERIDLVVDLTDARADEALRRATRRTYADDQRQ